MTTFTEDTADERKAKKEQRKELDLAAEERRKAVQHLYQTREGRTYLWWLLEITGAYGQNPFQSDPYATAFMCGQQNVGQRLLGHMMEVNPEAFANMLKERNNERRNSTASRRNRSGSNNDSDDGDKADRDDAARRNFFGDLTDPNLQYD